MQFISFLFCWPAPWFLQRHQYARLCIIPERVLRLCCLLGRDGREMEATSIFLSHCRGWVQWDQWAFKDVIMVEKGLVSVLWSPSGLNFISVNLYWLQELFPEYLWCSVDVLPNIILKEISTWDTQLVNEISPASSWHPGWLREKALRSWSSTEMRTDI